VVSNNISLNDINRFPCNRRGLG